MVNLDPIAMREFPYIVPAQPIFNGSRHASNALHRVSIRRKAFCRVYAVHPAHCTRGVTGNVEGGFEWARTNASLMILVN